MLKMVKMNINYGWKQLSNMSKNIQIIMNNYIELYYNYNNDYLYEIYHYFEEFFFIIYAFYLAICLNTMN